MFGFKKTISLMISVAMMALTMTSVVHANVVADGTYNGTAQVEAFGKYDIDTNVTVSNGKISNVEIQGKNFSGSYAEFNKTVLQKAIDGLKDWWNGKEASQDNADELYNVDVVSSATYSSKTIRDSVMDALSISYDPDSSTDIPDTVSEGIYTVDIEYKSEVVEHSLVEGDTATAKLKVDSEGNIILDTSLISGTSKEPLYILEFNGYYIDNNKENELTKTDSDVQTIESEYEDTYFPLGTKTVSHLSIPLKGSLTDKYYTNMRMYVPAMNNLNGTIQGIEFENGKFSVDCYIKIAWGTLKKMPDSYSLIIPERTDFGVLTLEGDASKSYDIKVDYNNFDKDKIIVVSSDETGTLLSGEHELVFSNNTPELTFTPDQLEQKGSLTIEAENIKAAAKGDYKGFLTYNVTVKDADEGDDGSGGNSGSGTDEEVDVSRNGKYRVDICLWNATLNQESMGDKAFENNREAIITTHNNVSTIQIATNPVSIPPYYSALEDMQYKDSKGNWKDVSEVTRKTITANDGNNKHSLKYLQVLEFELPNTSDQYFPVKIKVPYTPMDSISANDGGFIEARLKIDWDTLRKTSSNDSLKPDGGSATGDSQYSDNSEDSDDNKEDELIHDVTDEKTGIRITAEKDVFDTKTIFEVTNITDGADYEVVSKLLGDYADNGYTMYKVVATLNDKEAKQTGFCNIYIPVGDEDVNKTVIYSYTEETANTNAGLTALEIELSEDKKYYILRVSKMGTFVVAEANENVNNFTQSTSDTIRFVDIESHWAMEYIKKAVKRGMFSGISETEFAPDETSTRAMLITVLSRIEGISADNIKNKENRFTDIKEDDWFYVPVLWAAENGIVSGVAENQFDPNTDITREQMATILYRYITYKGIALSDGEFVEFVDGEEFSEFAKEAINTLAKSKILSGKGNGIFDPKGTATRAELATMFVKFVDGYMTETEETVENAASSTSEK